MSALEKGNDPVALDRASSHEVAEKVTAPEAVEQVDEHEVAARGHFATDKYGRPLVHFDPVAEAKLRLKIDCYVVPTVAMLYLFCFIDRANIGNAKLAGLEKDLGMKGYDYNIVLTCFYVSYIAFEIPANLLCKLVGPGWFLPATTLGFGLLSLCTAFVHSRGQACAVRFLLGVFEAGMMPGVSYYLSRWYRKSELVFRLSLYIVTAPLAGAFGGLLASAILKLPGIGSLHSWRMIFLVEGVITMGLAIIAFFTLTDRPATARWLTQEEKDMAIARVKSENVGTTEVLDKIDTPKLVRGILNPNTLATAFVFLLNNITVQGLAFFLPTIVATIYPKSSTVHKQLMTVPPYITGAALVPTMSFASWKLNKRVPFFILTAPLMIIGYIIFLATGVADKKARYGATFLIATGAFPFGSLTNAQASANVLSDTSRSAAIGTNVMFGNIGGLISTWCFLATDGPNYPIGNGVNLATNTLILLTSIGLFFFILRDNRRRDQIDVDQVLAGKSVKEIQDLDWKHPSFRWKM